MQPACHNRYLAWTPQQTSLPFHVSMLPGSYSFFSALQTPLFTHTGHGFAPPNSTACWQSRSHVCPHPHKCPPACRFTVHAPRQLLLCLQQCGRRLQHNTAGQQLHGKMAQGQGEAWHLTDTQTYAHAHIHARTHRERERVGRGEREREREGGEGEAGREGGRETTLGCTMLLSSKAHTPAIS